MASNYTTNYELPLWEPQDSFLRTEFNDANQKIDAGLTAANAERIHVGSYTGDGSSNRTIQLPCTPKLLIVFGYINGNAALGLYTQQDGRRVTESCAGPSSYDIMLNGDAIQIQNKDWNNANGKAITNIALG